MTRKKYYIKIEGSEGTTGFPISLFDFEFKLISKISEISKIESNNGYEPTIEIEVFREEN